MDIKRYLGVHCIQLFLNEQNLCTGGWVVVLKICDFFFGGEDVWLISVNIYYCTYFSGLRQSSPHLGHRGFPQ